MPDTFRARNLQETTETLLLEGLRRRGVDAMARGHAYIDSWQGFDVVHLNHLANSCVRMLIPQPQKVVFSRHATKAIPTHHRVILRSTYRNSDAVVVSSEMEKRRLVGTVPESKLHVIRNGINASHFLPTERTHPTPTQRWRFLYVGQLIELKRVEIAIRTLAGLLRQGHDVQLDIVSQRETLRPELEMLAAELSVSDRVRFLGPRTRAQTGELMREAHALVLPSRTEALPTVVTEAAFSALPVIAFQVGGISEQLPPGQRLPAVDDVNGFFESAKYLIENYTSIANAYARHVDKVHAAFSIDEMVDRHINVYRRLVE